MPDSPTPIALARIRRGEEADLPGINRVIAAARESWDLPERVRRLAGRLHELEPPDLHTVEVLVAQDGGGAILGVAVAILRPPRLDDGASGRDALWLDGLFVDPAMGRQGLGGRLLDAVAELALVQGLSRIDLRARREAVGFFRHRGFLPLGQDDARHAMTLRLRADPTGRKVPPAAPESRRVPR